MCFSIAAPKSVKEEILRLAPTCSDVRVAIHRNGSWSAVADYEDEEGERFFPDPSGSWASEYAPAVCPVCERSLTYGECRWSDCPTNGQFCDACGRLHFEIQCPECGAMECTSWSKKVRRRCTDYINKMFRDDSIAELSQFLGVKIS